MGTATIELLVETPETTTEITETAAARLSRLEGIIETGLRSFIAVAAALDEIRDRNLYIDTHNTFADYCLDRWKLSVSSAYKIMQAAEVARNIAAGSNADVESIPQSPPQNQPSYTQAVAMASLTPEQQREIAAETDFAKTTVQDIKEKVAIKKPSRRIKETDEESPAPEESPAAAERELKKYPELCAPFEALGVDARIYNVWEGERDVDGAYSLSLNIRDLKQSQIKALAEALSGLRKAGVLPAPKPETDLEPPAKKAVQAETEIPSEIQVEAETDPVTVKVTKNPAKKVKMPPASYIRNKSRYPDAEVNRLIEFAADEFADTLYGLDLRKTWVQMMDDEISGHGKAGGGIRPQKHGAPKGAKYIVRLWMGPDDEYPRNNLQEGTWEKAEEANPKARRMFKATTKGVYSADHYRDGTKCPGEWGHYIYVPHAYGGKGSPVMEHRNWREWLVALAAHEFNHIYQFQNKLPGSEVACEKRAASALERYRASKAPVIEMAAD
jgi:hypothetical protein